MRAFYARRHCLLLTVLALAVVVMMAGCESGTYQAVASSPLYTIITQLKVAPGALNQAEAALATLAAASREQDGCRAYQSYRCVPDPYGGQNYDFMTYENWTTEANGDAHLASAAFAAFVATVTPLLSQPMNVVLSNMISTPEGFGVDPAHITVVSRMWAQPGQMTAAENSLTGMLQFARSEPGCASYDLHQGTTEPNQFIFHESWRNQAAVDTHLASPQFAAFFAQSGELFVNGYIEVNFLQLISQ